MNMFLPLGALAEDDVSDLQDFLNTYHCAAKYFIGFDGMTLLHYAAQQGSGKVTAWLVHPHRGLDLNARNIQGRTALFIAASTGGPGSAKVVEILLKAGADPSIPTLIGSTVLMVARSAEVMKMLLLYPVKKEEDENEKKEVGITEVADEKKRQGEGGRKRGKQLILVITGGGLVGKGDEDDKDYDEAGTKEKERRACQAYRCRGESCGGGGRREGAPGSDEKWEGEGGRKQIATQIPVDMDTQDVDGHTALHYAMFGGRKAHWALPLLLAHGANPWVKDSRKRLPIYYLSRHSQPALIDALLERAMTSPPPRVWSLCKARAAGEVEEMEERKGGREGGDTERQEGSRPSETWGAYRTGMCEGMGGSDEELIEEEEGEEEREKEMAQEERSWGRKGRVACSVEGRAKKGNKMPCVVWREGNMKVKEAKEVVEAVVRFVVGGGGERTGREGGRAVLPTEIFAELVELMDWQGRDG